MNADSKLSAAVSLDASYWGVDVSSEKPIEQIENDGDRHQPHDAVVAERGEELDQISDNVTEEGDVVAEQHLQHDAEGDEQEAQLRDPYDPGFGLVENFHHLLFLRLALETRRSPLFALELFWTLRVREPRMGIAAAGPIRRLALLSMQKRLAGIPTQIL